MRVQSSSNYTLFWSPGSCSFAAHIALEEIGRPFELQKVMTDKGETQSEQFLQLNPKGRIPLLVSGDWKLSELPAILLHIAFENSDFAPQGGEELVRAVEWMNWLSGTVHSVAVRQIWRTGYFSDNPSCHESIAAKGRFHLNAAFDLCELRFAQFSHDWVLPSQYTIVDPFTLVFYRWGNRLGIPMRERYTNWTRHAERMETRPAVQRALATEQISLWE